MKQPFTTNIGAHRQSIQATPAGQISLTIFALLLMTPFCLAQSGDASSNKA